MKPEVSAGAIIFRRYKKRREYLLLHYEAGHWDFAKGHLEKGESVEQAARREIFEETGLHQLRLYSNFKHTIRYWLWPYRQKVVGQKPKRILKFVTFFVAETQSNKVRLSFEHTGYVWLPYKDALKLVTYNNAKELLTTAEAFLNSYEHPHRKQKSVI